MVKFCNFCFKNQNFEPKMAIFNYSGIRSLLFEYSNNIRSPKSDRISNRITLFGTQLFEYSNNSNYSFKHCKTLVKKALFGNCGKNLLSGTWASSKDPRGKSGLDTKKSKSRLHFIRKKLPNLYWTSRKPRE